MGDERFQAIVVQADGIEHAAGGFDRSPGRIAGARLLCDCLRNDAAQPRKIDQARHFAGIAKCARSHQNWVGQRQAAERHGKIDTEVGTGTWEYERLNSKRGALIRVWLFGLELAQHRSPNVAARIRHRQRVAKQRNLAPEDFAAAQGRQSMPTQVATERLAGAT